MLEYEVVSSLEDMESIYKGLRDIVDYFRSQFYHEHMMQLYFEDTRKLPLSVADDLEAFAVPDESEISIDNYPPWMHEYVLGFIKNNHLVMEGRCVFPVKNARKQVIGFIGWDPFATPKYRDSNNAGYKAGMTTFLGMENIEDYYNSDKPVFITEGSMCMAYLRLNQFQAMSSLGSHLTKYQIQILKRFGRRCIVVVDNDEAGYSYANQVKYTLPQASVVMVTHGKDIEGCRKVEDFIYENDLLNDLNNIHNPFYIPKELIRRK